MTLMQRVRRGGSHADALIRRPHRCCCQGPPPPPAVGNQFSSFNENTQTIQLSVMLKLDLKSKTFKKTNNNNSDFPFCIKGTFDLRLKVSQ